MDVSEKRRLNVLDLVKQHGTIEALAAATGSAAAHISQIKNKTRGMGHGVARRFEKKLGLPAGWMDTRDHAPSQGTLESATLLEDFASLPPALQEHVARTASELRALVDGVPLTMRPMISAPPKDPDRYREWEASIKALVAEVKDGVS